MSNPITVGFTGLTKRIFAGRSKPSKLAPGVREFTGEKFDVTTGMSKHMIQHARRSTWMEGKHYRHVAPDMAPKQNSPIMYNRDEINHWIEHQSPAKRRRISA
ncbi:TPA: excisionase family protein [Escherichia coli]|nr:excisionase family protein [Escherichia coli]